MNQQTQHTCSCNSCHTPVQEKKHHPLRMTMISAFLFISIICIDYFTHLFGDLPWLRVLLFALAFIPVGFPVIKEGIEIYREEHNIFNECTLMTLASIGAFAIGEYPEAIVLMILYNVGEWLQGLAVGKARKSISDLVDVRTEWVTRIDSDGNSEEIKAEDAHPGDTLRLSPGMRISLDSQLVSPEGLLDLSALTGESTPMEVVKGEPILAGSVVMSKPIVIEVSKEYHDSTLARIVEMTEDAAERKPKTEKFIRRFSKIYTPIVTGIAALVILIPWVWSLVSPSFHFYFSDWLYRSLVFLVTSCPCALIISVPLTYFCGIGAASRSGILFKGASYLEILKDTQTVIFDKTGTLTVGSFGIKALLNATNITPHEALALLYAIEEHSTHPIAQAITNYAQAEGIEPAEVLQIEEISGLGLKSTTPEGARIVVGSERWMERLGIEIPESLHPRGKSSVLLCIDEQVAATIILEDQIKEESLPTISALHSMGLKDITMLSGDKQEVVDSVAQNLDISYSFGELLPHEKMEKVEQIMKSHKALFVGDGLNDAPVMSMADVGMAMGGIASDATIEAADIVIQGNNPFKVVESIEIAHQTHRIVLQNIIFALGFKLLVMILATIGFASLTLAIIADVGVTLLVIANSLRALTFRSKYNR